MTEMLANPFRYNHVPVRLCETTRLMDRYNIMKLNTVFKQEENTLLLSVRLLLIKQLNRI